jgi:hypothetical protein
MKETAHGRLAHQMLRDTLSATNAEDFADCASSLLEVLCLRAAELGLHPQREILGNAADALDSLVIE